MPPVEDFRDLGAAQCNFLGIYPNFVVAFFLTSVALTYLSPQMTGANLLREDNEVLVRNLSFKEFNPEQIPVLKHAAGFNITDAVPVNPVATIESVLKHSQEPAETQHLIRQQVTALVMAHKPRLVIPRAQQDDLRTLKAEKSIVILPADKGRSTVILDKVEYIRKANALLEDS
ncbi:hypothetical protein SprV_0301280600 [Sparganum proliferum]